MHVISKRKIREFISAGHADAKTPLEAWYRTARAATWSNVVEVRRTLRDADPVGKYTVFNVKGNAYRLISEIYYPSQVLLIRHILTHAEYTKGAWK